MEWRQLELGLPDLANKNSGYHLGCIYTKTFFFFPLVHLKFKFNWASRVLSGNSSYRGRETKDLCNSNLNSFLPAPPENLSQP